jgi:hypothetical protein
VLISENKAALVDLDTFSYTPTPEQKKKWENCTGIPFEADAYKESVHDKEINCPYCETVFTHPWEDQGSGYGELHFSGVCSSCKEEITHDRLCTAIFLKEVEAIRDSETAIIS